MDPTSSVIVVFVTVGSEENALAISQTLVSEKLAACVNIVPGIRSIYRWKDKLCDDRESLLIIKTTKHLLEAVEETTKKIHTYDVPEIVSFPLQSGSTQYLSWLEAAVDPSKP